MGSWCTMTHCATRCATHCATYSHIRTCVCMYMLMYVCMYLCKYVWMYACMYVCSMHVCMYVYMYTCMYVCMQARREAVDNTATHCNTLQHAATLSSFGQSWANSLRSCRQREVGKSSRLSWLESAPRFRDYFFWTSELVHLPYSVVTQWLHRMKNSRGYRDWIVLYDSWLFFFKSVH